MSIISGQNVHEYNDIILYRKENNEICSILHKKCNAKLKWPTQNWCFINHMVLSFFFSLLIAYVYSQEQNSNCNIPKCDTHNICVCAHTISKYLCTTMHVPSPWCLCSCRWCKIACRNWTNKLIFIAIFKYRNVFLCTKCKRENKMSTNLHLPYAVSEPIESEFVERFK